MEKLEKFLKLTNLLFTHTLKREDFARKGFNLEEYDVNYTNCISIWELISMFNEVYLNYKQEYLELDKFGFKDLDYFCFDKNSYEDYSKVRLLSMFACDEKINNHSDPDIILHERTENDVVTYNSFIESEEKNPYLPGYYLEKINLDSNKVKNMLDFFEKYDPLYQVYKSICCCFPYVVFNFCGSLEQSNIESVEISFSDPGYYYFFKNFINIGENFGIDVNESVVYQNDMRYVLNQDFFENLLREVYINRNDIKGIDELETLYQKLNQANKIKKK